MFETAIEGSYPDSDWKPDDLVFMSNALILREMIKKGELCT